MRGKEQFSYDGDVGRWWLNHSLDAAHRRAYRNITNFIRDSFVRDPRLIVDYACGPGTLLALLSLRFRNSRLLGLDGSSYLLDLARRQFSLLPKRCAERITLIETELPNLSLLRGKADLVIFCFPNMVAFGGGNFPGKRVRLSEGDRRVAKSLSVADDPDGEGISSFDSAANQRVLEQGRCVSLNLRRLLVPGGICVRVEYATMQRHELSPCELSHVSFEEGSLDSSVYGRTPRLWFRLLASAYFRSKVLEDVYEQTGDERDKDGGYLITVLRAV
ncbi:MAG: Methyltransferase domain [Acidobacteria bacterium]|jgi:SAM-dependent methyltransferase|nr:Methyltransferase domain [Acidobacteriota bacterium]